MNTKTLSKRRLQIHYVPSTHWDREWYLPFQGFRYKLVKVVDTLIDILEADPRYQRFVFDGQTVALADYLEIKPENRPRLEALLRSGRILVGPWYTMPDERILSGESLIRNLLRGFADARRFGAEPMRYGYVCDIFGHIAQMPQIFAGMGIAHALVWRGTNQSVHPAHMIWRAPDGSDVLTFRLDDDGSYGTAKPIWDAAHAANPKSPAWREGVLTAARKLRDSEAARSNVPVLLWLDGQDHQVPNRWLPDALDVIQEAMPDADILFSDLPAMARQVEPYRQQLPVFAGELVEPTKDDSRWLAFIQHCLSSHYPMKRLNDQCQTLLEKWAEPIHAWATLLNKAPTPAFLDHAWQYLLQNHPHDSICGCSIDQVHKDTEYRYDQCRIIANEVMQDCLQALTPPAKPDARSLVLSIFHPDPLPASRVVTFDFDYPADFPRRPLFGFPDEPSPCFNVLDSRGRRVDYQLHSYVASTENRCRISVEMRTAGLGVSNLRIVPGEKWYRAMGTQLTGAQRAENEHLILQVADNGTLTIMDKATGRIFKDQCIFEDTADVGDGWYHVRPFDNQTILSIGFSTSISVVTDGPLVTTFRIEKRMPLPRDFAWHERRRCRETREVTVTLDATLRKGARHVECRAALDNTVKDHRLRVLFPTGIGGSDYFASQPFTVVTRRRGVNASTFDWKECDVEERDFNGLAGVTSRQGGFALIAGNGHHEVAVKADPAGTIALTLMRAFKKTVKAPMDDRSQLLHRMEFDWQIVPFDGKPNYAALTRQQQAFQAGMQSVATRNEGGPNATFLKAETGSALLSCLKTAQDRNGLILRVYNPTERSVKDRLTFAFPFRSAIAVNHAEEPLAGAKPIRGGKQLPVELSKQKIRTYRLLF